MPASRPASSIDMLRAKSASFGAPMSKQLPLRQKTLVGQLLVVVTVSAGTGQL
jgi:hypothetical protein